MKQKSEELKQKSEEFASLERRKKQVTHIQTRVEKRA